MRQRPIGCRSDQMCACGAMARDGSDACEKCISRARWSRRKQQRAQRDSQ